GHILAAEEKLRQTGWLKPNCYRQALIALALGVRQRNFFQLADTGIRAGEAPAEPRTGNHRVPEATGPARASPSHPPAAHAPGTLARIGRWFRRAACNFVGMLRALPSNSAVHIMKAERYDVALAGILHKQYELFRATVPLQGKRFVLKPNLVEWHRDKVI